MKKFYIGISFCLFFILTFIKDAKAELIYEWQLFEYDGSKYCIISEEEGTCRLRAYKKGELIDSIYLPETVYKDDKPYIVTEIGTKALENKKGLQYVNIPNSVTSIQYDAFAGCQSLESIQFSNSLTYIGSHAFGRCESLKSIELPQSLLEIDSEAFMNCKSLQSIIIPNNVERIGWEAFQWCDSLSKLVLGESVKFIESAAFVKCPLMEITFLSITPPEIVEIFSSKDYSDYNTAFYKRDDQKVYVRSESLEAYKNSEYWYSFNLLPLDSDDVTTEVDELENTVSTEYIIFNLQGQRIYQDVNSLPKGLYLVNGKKVFVN